MANMFNNNYRLLSNYVLMYITFVFHTLFTCLPLNQVKQPTFLWWD